MSGFLYACMHVERNIQLFNLLPSALLWVLSSAVTKKGSSPTSSRMCWRSSSLTSEKSSSTNWPARCTKVWIEIPSHSNLPEIQCPKYSCENPVSSIHATLTISHQPSHLVFSSIATALPSCNQYQGISPQLIHCSLDLSFEGRQPIRSDPFCVASALKQHMA